MVSKQEIYDMLEITRIDLEWLRNRVVHNEDDKLHDHVANLGQRIYRLMLTIKADVDKTRGNAKFNRDWKRAKKIAGNLNLDFFNILKWKILSQEKAIQKIKDNHNI